MYNVSKMITPTAFFFGGCDSLSNATDVEALIPKVPDLVLTQFFPKWNHVDFVFGEDATQVLYDHLVKIMHDSSVEQ